MRHGETVELEIPSAPEYVTIARQAVEGVARRMGFSVGQIDDLKLAVGEACTNAIRHGCNGESARNVELRCIVLDDGLLVEVRNSIFQCESPRVPETPDLGREGGLGLYIIDKLVDEVEILFDEETATVKMIMRRSCS